MKIINPEHQYYINSCRSTLKSGPSKDVKVFLAGTIDDGASNNWQMSFIEHMVDNYDTKHITILNPRRTIWDKDSCDISEQIKWEQAHLDEADFIVMNIEKGSKSPISMLELGLYAQSGKLMVFCENSFYRFSNVLLTCEQYNIPLYACTVSYKEMVNIVISWINATNECS